MNTKKNYISRLKFLYFLFPFVPLLLSLNFVFLGFSWGLVNPNIKWEIISTPHFDIAYDAEQYQTARKYALRLELNHKLLTQFFTTTPDKTLVIINDNTDLANGYATPIPYYHMMIYPVLPTSHDTISEYGDWPRELTLHEYAHIVNFSPTRGVMKILRNVFGSIITPTLLLPRWWHEGIAVEMETRYSEHGRLRSLYQDSSLRALVKAQKLNQFAISDINESDLESWPRGARPYLFGSILMSEILTSSIETKDENNKGLNKNYGDYLLQSYGGRFPYFINGPLEDDTDLKFYQWFAKTLQTTENLVNAQLHQIRQTMPTTVFTPFATQYMDSHSPQLSPNGNILTFVAKNHWGKSSIQIYDRRDNHRPFDLKADSLSEFLSVESKTAEKSKDAPPPGNINKVTWLSDSSGFIFDQVRFTDSYSNYSDLFFYDLSLKKNRRLTTGQRLRDAAISLDSLTIAAIQLKQSSSRIVTLDREGKNLQTLYIPEDFHKVANPVFVNNNTLLFTERDLSGQTHVKSIDLTSKAMTELKINNLSSIDSLNPEYVQNNFVGISFVAQQNGMENFYYTNDLFKTYHQLTHTETAVFDGCIDNKTNLIYTTLMTETGLQVQYSQNKVDWDQKSNSSSILNQNIASSTKPMGNPETSSNQNTSSTSKIDSIYGSRYQNTKPFLPNDTLLESEFGTSISSPSPYSSTKYLVPKYWLPFIYTSDSGYGAQISTSAFDPLEKHSYSLQAGYDSYAHKSNFLISYGNTTTTWPMIFTYLKENRTQPIMDYSYDFDEINFLATHDLRPLSEDMTIGIGLDGQSSGISKDFTTKRFGPQFAFIFDGSGKSPYSKTPFSGYQFSLFGNYYYKAKDLKPLTRGIAKASYYHSRFLPSRHIANIHFMIQQSKGSLSINELSTSDPYPLAQDMLAPRFSLRGYDSGYFYFWNARSMTLEYHMPLGSYFGLRTFPAFLKRTHLNLFTEAMSVDGNVIDFKQKLYTPGHLNQYFTSFGFELKADLTLGYYLPMTWFIGLYQRPEYSKNDKLTAFFGIQM